MYKLFVLFHFSHKKNENKGEVSQMKPLDLENWTIKNQQLYRKISLPNFKVVMLYANEIAELAENMNHHPRLVIAYDLLEIYLYTFDQQEITNLDYELAQKIEVILLSPLPHSN